MNPTTFDLSVIGTITMGQPAIYAWAEFDPDVTQAYLDAPRSDDKSPSEHILSGKWKGYTPPPMPEK